MVAAARLIDLGRIRYAAIASKADAVLLILTAVAALVIGIEFAILIGAALSIVWYLLHASRLKTQELVVDADQVVRVRIPSDTPAKDVAIYDIEGDLFFGAAPDLQTFLQRIRTDAQVAQVGAIVLRLKRVRNPDAVALEVLDHFLKETRNTDIAVFLAGVRPELKAALDRLGIVDRLGSTHVFPEEQKDYSATLGAIRAAYDCIDPERGVQHPRSAAYYLV